MQTVALRGVPGTLQAKRLAELASHMVNMTSLTGEGPAMGAPARMGLPALRQARQRCSSASASGRRMFFGTG